MGKGLGLTGRVEREFIEGGTSDRFLRHCDTPGTSSGNEMGQRLKKRRHDGFEAAKEETLCEFIDEGDPWYFEPTEQWNESVGNRHLRS